MADGGMRNPSEEEEKLSPHESFIKVEIFESECKIPEIYQLQCRLKDIIYFPYIQCDELKTGRTIKPVGFQVNGEDFAEITGGEVAISNLNSKGDEFWFQIRLTLTGDKRKGTSEVANARLKFVYFPIVQGKESIDKILETLEEDGSKVSESFQNFGRVSIRRLCRLLPEVRWSIPFMQRGARASTLQECCERVKCFVDLDAGFSSTPSKTDLVSQNPFSVALRNFGSKSTEKEKDSDVHIDTHREGKPLNYQKLEHAYQEWVLEMHNTHDEEAASGEDEAILIVGDLDKKALVITRDAVRVHKVMRRKEKKWKRGQKINILRGAYVGVHNNNVYTTIDYFLIEGFEDKVGEGCTLSIIDGISQLDLRSSLSLPIAIIDSGKCLPVDKDEWNEKLEKQQEKAPSRVDLLDESDCRVLNIDGELLVGDSVRAGRAPPQQIVAVLRPACFTSSTLSKKLEQKHIVKDGEEMIMVVKLQEKNLKSSDKNGKPVCTERLLPTSRKGIHGLYNYSLGSKFPDLFKKAGTYNFCFSIGNSIKCKKTVVVRSSSKAAKWKLDGDLESMLCDVKVGSCLPPFCIGCFDDYDNRIPFTSAPSLEVELEANPGFHVNIDKFEANLINSGSILKIKNMLVETDGLDQIRPNYEATLEIHAKDKPFSVSVACDVNPGPLKRVAVNNPQALENLLPGSTVEGFMLEIFDGYNNHVREGASVLIDIDGFRIEDWMDANRKVDDRGCIDLSGILKVIEGYVKSVSIFVISDNKEIFRKESQIEKRSLRLETELPSCCAACSNLENLLFKVTDSDGAIDTSIHHDEKCGCFHTMGIESDSSSFDGIRYAFVHGSCKVPSLSLPEDEGVVAFRVYHSRYPELQMSFKIQLMPAPTFERDETGCSTPPSGTTPTPQSGMSSSSNPWATPTPSLGLEQTPCSQFGVLAIKPSSLALSSQTALMDIVQYAEV